MKKEKTLAIILVVLLFSAKLSNAQLTSGNCFNITINSSILDATQSTFIAAATNQSSTNQTWKITKVGNIPNYNADYFGIYTIQNAATNTFLSWSNVKSGGLTLSATNTSDNQKWVIGYNLNNLGNDLTLYTYTSPGNTSNYLGMTNGVMTVNGSNWPTLRAIVKASCDMASVDCNFTPSIMASSTTPDCGAALTLTGNITGSEAGINYAWSGNAATSIVNPWKTVSPVTTTATTYTLTASKTGCNAKSATIIINTSCGTTTTGGSGVGWSQTILGGVSSLINTNSSGKVIIGSVPSIPADYNLYVSGGILTEKAVIAIKSTSNWADYVFDKNYYLKSLEEVESFITVNKHLPEIPTTQTVLAEGINVGEIQSKLLRKIEELTLYIIEQNKINKLQDVKIDQLSKLLQK